MKLTPAEYRMMLLRKALVHVAEAKRYAWSAFSLAEQLESGNGTTGREAYQLGDLLQIAHSHARELGRIITEHNLSAHHEPDDDTSPREEPACAVLSTTSQLAQPIPPHADEK